MNKKRVDLLVNWNILYRNTVQSWTKRESIYLSIYICTFKLEYVMLETKRGSRGT